MVLPGSYQTGDDIDGAGVFAGSFASLEIDEGFRFDTGMGPDDLVPAIRFGPVDKS